MSHKRLHFSILLMCSLALDISACASETDVTPLDVRSATFSQFRIGSAETRFGPLEFIGGLELRASNDDFGGFSAFRYLDAGRSFVGVTDTGFWYAGTMQRDGDGRPVSVADFRLAPIRSGEGDAVRGKRNGDAEGLDVSDGIATISFERNHRIAEYALDLDKFASTPVTLPLPMPRHELRTNRGIETVTRSPAASPLEGARIAVSEMSLNAAGDMFGAVLEGPRKGVFYVARRDDFDISDGDFLPNGDLVLLERKFRVISGVSIRLRRIAADDIRAGATLQGTTMLEADLRSQIDNMEGLDIWQAEDGSTHLSMISDDNRSIVQRNLYLEFRLAE